MCILLKLHYAKFNVSRLFCLKLWKKNLCGVGSTPPLVKEGLSRIEFIFALKVSWDNKHQPHTSLLWLLSQHSNQSETSITPLS